MLRPIVIHFVPSELLTAFAVACTIVTGAKTSLRWLFSGLPPAVRRHLLTPTLNASPMAPPPSPPVNWTPQPTVTVYQIQYIEPLPVTSNPYNPFPFSATSSSPFDQWNTPSWASPSDSPYGGDPMVARYAVLLCTVAMVFFMLIAGAFTVYHVAVKAIVGGRIIRRELAEQERLQKTYTSTSVGSDGLTDTPAAVHNNSATQIPFNWRVSEGNLIPHTDLSRERGLTARTERKDGRRVRAETTSHTKGNDSILTKQQTVGQLDLKRKKPTSLPGPKLRRLPVQLRSEGSVKKETESSHALQALPSASHVQVPPPVTAVSSTNTNGQENTDFISAPSESMLSEVLDDNGASENRATTVDRNVEKERPTTLASSNEVAESVNSANGDACANGANVIDGLKDVGVLSRDHELPSPANISHVASKAEQSDTIDPSSSQDDRAPSSSRLPDAKAQETLAIHPSVPEGKAVVSEVASETSTRTGAGSSRDDSDVPTTVNGREKKHDITTVISPMEPISLELSMSGLSPPEPSDDGANTVHVNAEDAPESSVPLIRSEEQEKTVDYPAPVTSSTSVSDPKPGPDDQPSGSPQAHNRIGETSLQNDDKSAPSSAQPGSSPTEVNTNQNVQEESKEPGEPRQIRKVPKRALAEKGKNLPPCPVAPKLTQEDMADIRAGVLLGMLAKDHPDSMFRRYWNKDAGKQHADAAIPSGSSSVPAEGASESRASTVDPNVEQERPTTPASSNDTTRSVNHVNGDACASGSNVVPPTEPTPLEPSSSGLSHSEPSNDDTNSAQVTEGGAQETKDQSERNTRSLQDDDISAPPSAQQDSLLPTDVSTSQHVQEESKNSEHIIALKKGPLDSIEELVDESKNLVDIAKDIAYRAKNLGSLPYPMRLQELRTGRPDTPASLNDTIKPVNPVDGDACADVSNMLDGREKTHATTTEPASLVPSTSSLSRPGPSDDGANTTHVSEGGVPETSLPMTKSEEQKTADSPPPVTSSTSVSDTKSTDDQPTGSPQAHDRTGETSLQNDDKAAPSSAQPGSSPTDVNTIQNVQEESKVPGEPRQIRKLPKRALAEKGKNLPPCPVAPKPNQRDIAAICAAELTKMVAKEHPDSMFRRYWNKDAGKQHADEAAIPSGSSSVQADGASGSSEPTVDPNVEQERLATPASSNNTTTSLTGSVHHINGNACASGSNVIDGTEKECDTSAGALPTEPTPLEPSSSGLSHSEPSDDDNSAPSSAQQDSAPTDGATIQDAQKLKKLLKKQRQKAKRMSTILPSVPQAGPSVEARPAASAEQNVVKGFATMSEKKAGKQKATTISASVPPPIVATMSEKKAGKQKATTVSASVPPPIVAVSSNSNSGLALPLP